MAVGRQTKLRYVGPNAVFIFIPDNGWNNAMLNVRSFTRFFVDTITHDCG